MKNALIIHDTDSAKTRKKREDYWYPWLKKQLKEKKYKVFLQEMPLSWKPNTDLYWDFLKEKFNFNKESIIIGHGTGATALLGILQKLPQVKSIEKVVLVSPHLKLEGKEFRALFKKDFDWKNIKGKANEIYVLYSEDDEDASPEQSKEAAEKLDAKIKKFDNKGHFEEDELSELLEIIF